MSNQNISEEDIAETVTDDKRNITPEVFSAAYEKLQLQGKKITTRNLRDAIGYGSFGTIQKFLRERNRVISLGELSEVMPQKFLEQILTMGKSMYDYLQQGCTRERIKLQDEYDQLSAEMAEHNETLESKLKSSLKQQKQLEDENVKLRQELELERKLNHELQTQLLKKVTAKDSK